MTLYTFAAFNKIKKDLQRLSRIMGGIAPFMALVYLCYALIVGAGNQIINIVSALLSFAYLIYYFSFLVRIDKLKEKKKKNKKEIKQIKKEQKNTKRAYKISKLCVGVVSLSVSIYTVYVTLSNVTPLSVLLVGLSAIAWLLNLIVFLAYEFFVAQFELLVDGFQYDIERIDPIKNVKDVINKAQGKEVEVDTDKISAKNRALLDKLLQKEKETKEKKKIEKESMVKTIINSVLKKDENENV